MRSSVSPGIPWAPTPPHAGGAPSGQSRHPDPLAPLYPAPAFGEAAGGLISILQGRANAGLWFVIVWVPGLLFLGLIVGVAWWLARRAGIHRPRGGGRGLQPPPSLPGEAAASDTWR